jgi:hypothetical protein
MTISTIFGDLNKKTLERIFTRILIPSKKEEYKKALGSVSFLFSMIPDKVFFHEQMEARISLRRDRNFVLQL